MEGTIRLQFLGTMQVTRGREPVEGFRSRKALALLGYLAVQGQSVPRERLAELFWEGKPEARGRANLTWVLGRLSTLLPGCLQINRHAIAFQPTPAYWSDVDAFEKLEGDGGAAALTEAVGLYRGDFLTGVCLEGCSEFEIWLAAERERWRRRVVRALDRLVAHHGGRGEYAEGMRLAERLLGLEPWREETHQQVMRLLAWGGRRGAALAQYEACRRVLMKELRVEPAAETTRLYEQIRDGELETPASGSVRVPDFDIPMPAFLGGKEGVPAEEPVFVSREAQLARLDRFFEEALEGGGRVVFVTGDAGQGKTALIQAFVRGAQAAYPDLVAAVGNANAHTGISDPYLPFREVLGLLGGDVEARWSAGAMGREQAYRLWCMLPLTARALVEDGPDLFDVFLPGAALVRRAAAMEMMTPGEVAWLAGLRELVARRGMPGGPAPQQNDLFEQVTRVLRRLAQERPLVVVLDDLQWVDAGSASLLFHLGRRIRGSRILIVGAYRPAEVALGREEGQGRHPLEAVVNELRRRFGEMEVDLNRAEGRRFVEAFLDTEPNRLGPTFRQMLYRQTGGHPLFTIELLRGLQERGDLVQDDEGRWVEGPALDWETLPARVEAVIAERIGRLSEASQQVLRVASVEGETFTAEVIARVQGTDERGVVEWLSGALDRRHRLVRAEGLQRLGDGRLSGYRFRHILFQRYLYGLLDPVERAHLHDAVGSALEALYEGAGEGTGAIAGQLARHFREAGGVRKAIKYLQQAAERAVRMSANEEAIAYFNQALGLLETLPDSPERAQQELMLLIGLAAPLMAARGFAAPEAGRVHARARELCRQVGDTPQLFPVVWHLANYYGTWGDHRTARELVGQLLDLAERAGDPQLDLLAHFVGGWNGFYLGELPQARAHHERVIAAYDPQLHHLLAFQYGVDPGVASLMFLSWVLWLLGYPDQALKRGREALALARELAHPHMLAGAQGIVGVSHVFRRDAQGGQELAEACIQLSTEQGFPYWLTLATTLRGWALIEQGRAEEGLAQVRQGMAGHQATGNELALPTQLVMLATGYAGVGQVDEALARLDEALAVVRRNEEVFHEAEIHRLKGKFRQMQGADEPEVCSHDAEACFRRAIEVARGQSARSWELRATTSLCRLRQAQGKREDARRELAAIYNWFTEGFDTPDLQEAKALLEELS